MMYYKDVYCQHSSARCSETPPTSKLLLEDCSNISQNEVHFENVLLEVKIKHNLITFFCLWHVLHRSSTAHRATHWHLFFIQLPSKSIRLLSACQQINELVSSMRRGSASGLRKYDLGQQETVEHFAWGERDTSARAWISHEGPF